MAALGNDGLGRVGIDELFLHGSPERRYRFLYMITTPCLPGNPPSFSKSLQFLKTVFGANIRDGSRPCRGHDRNDGFLA